ncbi:unnamed protein product [Paramecium octaurelia]|uniref:Uncharacterized protein n=1 Tax=Paramecium octaurelia TaxID=43137 RepID=A0A8S1U5W7_PAROT|nr:unnamed protein product [Paramecium octaurelia]
MDQDNYYQDRLEVESLQQRLNKTNFLEDDFENLNYQFKPNYLRTLQPVSFSDTEIKSTRQQTCKFKVLYKRTVPLNLKFEQKSQSQCHSESKSQIVKIRKRIAKKFVKKTNPK